MLIADYQHIKASDLLELDNTVLVYDENSEGNATRGLKGKSGVPIDRFYGFVTYKHYTRQGRYRTSIPFPLGAYIEDVYDIEMSMLKERIETNQHKTFFINPLGIFIDSGMLFFHCIRPRMPEDLKQYNNVVLLWNNIPNYREVRRNQLIPTSYGKNYTWADPSVPYSYLEKTGNFVDINRINNKHIPIDLPVGVYIKEK